jgi:hypothetical protein
MKQIIVSLLAFFFVASVPSVSFAELTDQQKQIPLEADAPDKAMTKIVLIAGTPSNKPGQHEYFAGCALLMRWLKQTPGVWPVLCAEGWPKNEAVLDGAKALVVFMDGGEKLAFLEDARWTKVRALMASGAGFVAFHQAVEVPAEKAEEYKGWLGAVWQPDIGFRGHWDVKFKNVTAHAVSGGLRPFDLLKDGWLCNLHFANKGVTPLIASKVPEKVRSTADAKAHADRAEVVAWAFERENGGRSFGFTGADLHANWASDDQRRLVLNGILWSAKAPLPDGGATVSVTPEELAENWDRKALKIAKKAQ